MRMNRVSPTRDYRPSGRAEVFVTPNLAPEMAADLAAARCCVPSNQWFDLKPRRVLGISCELPRYGPVGLESWRELAATLADIPAFGGPDAAALRRAGSDEAALDAILVLMDSRGVDCIRYPARLLRRSERGRRLHEASCEGPRPGALFPPEYAGDVVAVGEACLLAPSADRHCRESNAMLHRWKPAWTHVGPPGGDAQWLGIPDVRGTAESLAARRRDTGGAEVDVREAREESAVVDWAFPIASAIGRPVRIFVGDGRSRTDGGSVEAVDVDVETLAARFVTCTPPSRDTSFRRIEAEDTAAVIRLIHYRVERQRLKDEHGEAPPWMTFRG